MSERVSETFGRDGRELGAAERAALERIDAALERMERGTYGACVACDAPIDISRLEVFPDAERCGRCAAKP
jgi:RNA polymerase-binding transcription factor DksA